MKLPSIGSYRKSQKNQKESDFAEASRLASLRLEQWMSDLPVNDLATKDLSDLPELRAVADSHSP
jgi:hypothetical protein